jgi:acyl carrier protein
MERKALLKMVKIQFGKRNVRPEDRFIEDLNAESVDMVNLAANIEEKTGIFIPEEVIPELKSVSDLESYLSSHSKE